MISPALDILVAERPRIEAALRDVSFAGDLEPPVAAAARYAVEGGGKRLRPVLCVAAYRTLTPGPRPPAPLYRLAASLELIHSYSLVHDDLPSMDDDEVRRGRASAHVAHGVAVATVAGGALIPHAVRVLAEAARDLGLDDGARTDLVLALTRAAGGGGMVGGQLLDLEAERRSPALAELERIHRMKTGALLGAAPVMGAMAAGADADVRAAFSRYGAAVGLAFQITDDILDVTGSSELLGKTAGRDTELEKATFPGLAGLREARRRAAGEVDTAIEALLAAGVESDELSALARYAVERDR